MENKKEMVNLLKTKQKQIEEQVEKEVINVAKRQLQQRQLATIWNESIKPKLELASYMKKFIIRLEKKIIGDPEEKIDTITAQAPPEGAIPVKADGTPVAVGEAGDPEDENSLAVPDAVDTGIKIGHKEDMDKNYPVEDESADLDRIRETYKELTGNNLVGSLSLADAKKILEEEMELKKLIDEEKND